MLADEIQQLRRPVDPSSSVDHAVSYLDAHFTTIGQVKDGEELKRSLSQSQDEAERFRGELANSEYAINELKRQAKIQALSHINSAQELSLLRHSVADELGSLVSELSSVNGQGGRPTLLEEVETLHRNLKELQSVKEYTAIVHRALQLSEAAIDVVKSLDNSRPIVESHLSNYKLLQKLTISVGNACQSTDEMTGNGVLLVTFLVRLSDDTWLAIRDALYSSLLSALEKLQWPMIVDYVKVDEVGRNRFQKTFLDLLEFQKLGERVHGREEATNDGRSDDLYAIHALTRPVAQRFKYHFEGSRETNRLDKPEWYFAHILNVSHEHRLFLENVVQRILHKSSYPTINAWREFTLQLFPFLARKLRRSIPSILSNPPVLAHTVDQCLAFDDSIREAGFSLQGTFSSLQVPKAVSDEWEGVSDVILGNKGWFESWLAGERRFTEAQYEEIMSSPDAWHLVDDDSGDTAADHELKPTNSARRVKALVEQVTDRYKILPQFLHKTRFLISVQVPILEQYHTRISESLDAFEALSSLFTRAVPGALSSVQSGHNVDSRRATGGVEGSQRLIKAFVSAKWMSVIMTNWGEEVFFLELWQTIREKAALRSRVKDVELLPNPTLAVEEGTIFDELVKQYNTLADRAESMLVRQICGEVENDLKAHLFKPASTRPDTGEVLLSQSLLTPIARLSSHLAALHNWLPFNTAIALYRKVATHISTHILQRQVLYQGRGRMSSQEGKVVLDEANLWIETSRMALGGGLRRIAGPWEKLVDAGRLLSLEGEAFSKAVRVTTSSQTDEFRMLSDQLGLSSTSEQEASEVLQVREDYSHFS